MTSEKTRAGWRCGWLSREERIGPGARVNFGKWGDPDALEIREEICPGYLLHLPEVIEAARACRWFRKGQLALLYDVEISNVLRDAVDMIDGALSAAESAKMRAEFSR